MPLKSRRRYRFFSSDLPLLVGLLVVVVFFIGIGYLSYQNAKFLAEDALRVAHTHEVIKALGDVLSLMKDAETGQRGFIITSDERYLAPYTEARAQIDQKLADVERLTADNPEHQSMLVPVRERVRAKLAELAEVLELSQTTGFEAARGLMLTNRGKFEMDALRVNISEMEGAEKQLRTQRLAAMAEAYRSAVVSGILMALVGVTLSVLTAVLIRRTLLQRRRQDWIQAGRLGIATAVAGEQTMRHMGEGILKFLGDYLGAHAGAMFVRREGVFHRVALQGVPLAGSPPESFQMGDGLLGQAARDHSTIRINEVPEGYLQIGSGLGRGNPRFLVISAAAIDGEVNAVLELGFIDPLDDLALDLLKQASELIGVAVKSASYRENLQQLLEETQRQAEELQTQSEELKVNNEELEEQSRALKESQSRLEQQQAELEQTNSQLEEQAQMLEAQRDDLEQANASVQAKAAEVERASRYKSDFLANMSHELRTPLNSSLILSKLLADNPEGNLTADQIKYAQTIQSSGNDLLTLINDILDLSKIEAGHMEVHPEPTLISRLVSDLQRTFEPIAKEKGLVLHCRVAADVPESIETDRQRLEQVLKNLLSNACKFTESGSVELSVSGTGRVEFAVTDTGIGISEDHQRDIFEAFRQADGTISRKFGGTGLGLSISRELVRLLGGSIALRSQPGQGSTFLLTLPETYPGPAAAIAIQLAEPSPAVAPAAAESPRRSANPFRDDRERLTSQGRTILVVEDDASFAALLYEMVHELHFDCLVAPTAEEALLLTRQYLPSAILLDVGLPDNSGLSVLDRIKRDPRTRHIPIHVVSASDHSETALSLGAVGYLLKPVKREELIGALRQIEARFSSTLRRVLIVEDDTIQRESLAKLLGSKEVQTVGVGTVAKCLELLKSGTFDCMVLDLSLPDASGFSLLETLSSEEGYGFPPVIVYTGRDLSHDEEQRLRRYSKSIIIKGAKSPERLLDEVTLFLHQVVSDLPAEQQRMLKKAQNRDAILEDRCILIVEDDVRNIYSLTNILEPRGAKVQIARNGREALEALEKSKAGGDMKIDLVLMDVMMPEMDGLTATREIRRQAEWKKLPIVMLTAKAMRNDQERCLEAGANDYMAKPLEVEKLLSLVRVWMPR